MDAIAKFLVNQIKNGTVTYERVITSRPDLKDAIDAQIAKANS